MRREIIHIRVVKQRLEPGNIGYVRIAEFTEPVEAAVVEAAPVEVSAPVVVDEPEKQAEAAAVEAPVEGADVVGEAPAAE